MGDVKLWRYFLDGGTGQEWAEIVLTSSGMFAAVSDWGDYAYAWRSTGCSDFREFMIRLELDPEYVLGKISRADEYQKAETLRAVKKAICEARRSCAIGRDATRQFLNELHEEYNDLHYSASFTLWLNNSDGARAIGDAWEMAVHDHPHDAQMFCRRILPRLAAVLRAELEAERKSR